MTTIQEVEQVLSERMGFPVKVVASYRVGYWADVDRVILSVSQALDIPVKQIIGKSRKRHLVDARHIIVGLLKKYHPSIPVLHQARLLNRDHTTLLHNREKYNDLYKFNSLFREKSDACENRLKQLLCLK